MSTCFYLVGSSTKTYLWAGQSSGEPNRFYLYTNQIENTRQDQISAYLAIHLGRPVTLVSEHNLPDPEDYAEVVAAVEGGKIYFKVDPEQLEDSNDDWYCRKLGPDFRLRLPNKTDWKD
ncbi:hypothetical protein U2F10_03115 [Leptothoe sp. EHU-05/26/07-4]